MVASSPLGARGLSAPSFEKVLSCSSDEEEGAPPNCHGENLAAAHAAALRAPVRNVALPVVIVVAFVFAASRISRSDRQAVSDSHVVLATTGTQEGFKALQEKARPNNLPMERLEAMDDSETLSCSEQGLVYQPVDMHRETMTREPSIAHCQARCSRTHSCTRFAYFAPTGDCHLQDAFAAPSYQNPNWISGPSACSMRGRSLDILATLLRKDICYEVGVAYYRLDMEGATPRWADSILDCQRRCRAMPGCAHFSYDSFDGTCHLQDSAANAVKNPHSGMIAGPPTCQISRQRMVEIMEIDPTDAENARAPVLRPSATGQSALADDALALSCAEYNSAHTEEPLEGQPATQERGLSECQARCAAARGCAAFSFDVRHVGCHLFGAAGAKTAVARSGWLSGPPACSRTGGARALSAATVLMRSGACFERDTSYNVLDMPGSTPARAESIFECQRRCRDTPPCARFTYSSVDGMCHLESVSAAPVSDPDSGMIAGTPVCKVAADQLMGILMQIEDAAAEARAVGRSSPSPVEVVTDDVAAVASDEDTADHGGQAVADSAGAGAETGTSSGQCSVVDSTKWNATGYKNFQTDMHGCGTACLGGAPCVSDCFCKIGYSALCSQCFGDVSACTVSHCLFQCMGGVSSGCLACTREQCRPALLECTGFSRA